jgi:ribosome-binding protein aMBF1 (putative translation factor)
MMPLRVVNTYYADFAYQRKSSYNLPVQKSIHSDQYKRFLALLRELRIGAGLTQAELAARLQRDQTLISKIETGERRLDILELREICQAIGISLEKFIRRLEKALKQ